MLSYMCIRSSCIINTLSVVHWFSVLTVQCLLIHFHVHWAVNLLLMLVYNSIIDHLFLLFVSVIIEILGGKGFTHFSAVCWLFGRYLYKSLNYPIGLVESCWGGTPVEAWSSVRALQRCGLKESTLSSSLSSYIYE